MSNAAVTVILSAAVFESLIIIVGNIFTIFVFWKHRNKLKRTYLLLINLAIADLLTGLTEPIALGTFDIPQHLYGPSINSINIGGGNISNAFQSTFSFASVFFLVLISLERSFALIWPLHHRATSIKSYIYSVTFAWLTGISVGVLSMLALFGILDFVYWSFAFGSTMILCLITVCFSYLAIRKRLNRKDPVINAAHNRQNAPEQKAKLSRTLFVVISTSLLFWLPGIIVYCTYFFCSGCVSSFLFHIFNIFRLANSVVNPIIYSFRIPMFRKTFKQMKLCKQSKEYKVDHIH